MRLFNRKITLIIGKRGTEGKLFKDLRISFDVLKTDSKESNNATLSIFNLSDDTKGYLEQPNMQAILQVGYGEEENLKTIFIGDIITIQDEKNGVDIITKINCKDGYLSLNSQVISLGFGEDTNSNQIINQILKFTGLNFKGEYTLRNYYYKNGFSFIGKPKKALNIVFDKLGYDWSVVDGLILITDKGEVNTNVPVQLLTKNTGLINVPQRIIEKKVLNSTNNIKTTNGWNVESLIINTLNPKNVIKVETDNFNSLLKIKNIRFTGDTRSDDWKAKMECEAL